MSFDHFVPASSTHVLGFGQLELNDWSSVRRLPRIPTPLPLEDNYGNRVRQAIVTATFTNHVFRDPNVVRLFASWRARSDTSARFTRAAVLLDRIAKEAGVSGRSELLHSRDILDLDESQLAAIAPLAEELQEEWDGYLDQDTLDPALVHAEATDFLDQRNCAWPWLVMDVQIGYYVSNPGTLQDRLPVLHDLVSYPSSLAPDIKFNFETQAGETSEQLADRLATEIAPIIQRIEGTLHPRGTLPRVQTAKLEQYACWLYLHRFRGRSIRSLARTAFSGADAPEERTKDIRDGLKRALSLMGVSD